MVPHRIQDVYVPPELENTKIEGDIAQQMERFLYERVLSNYAKEVIYAETEEQFRLRLDDSTRVGMWRGEFWGKWIISACRVARYKHDEELKNFIQEASHRIIATADPDGYIGTYKDPMYMFPLDPEIGYLEEGWYTNRNWNIWCRKYTLWGLLESYLLTEDQAILDGTIKTTDQMLDLLEVNQIRLFDTGVMHGLPSGSIIKPMLILYRITTNKRYLDFCIKAASEWERKDGKIPNLITNGLSGKPIHRWYPWYKYPYDYRWGKAYEFMSCLDGLLELYHITGSGKYLESVKMIYKQLREHEFNTVFSVGFNDIFLHACEYINTISEPCDVIHWMRLCFELFKLTGEAEYMDTFERAFLNPFLAASFSDGKWGARGVRSSGRHMVAVNQSGMKHSHCCVNNMPRGYMNASQAFVMQKDDDLYINLYTDYKCSFDKATISIYGSYLADGNVTIEINSTGAQNAYLRIPSWSHQTIVNDIAVEGSNSYHIVPLQKGCNFIAVRFDMAPRIIDFKREPEVFEDDDPRIVRYISDDGMSSTNVPVSAMIYNRRSTIHYGPLLLTRSKKNGNTRDEMFLTDTICGKNFSCMVQPTKSTAVRNAYIIKLTSGNETITLRMCDYATGTNEWGKEDSHFFSIYV